MIYYILDYQALNKNGEKIGERYIEVKLSRGENQQKHGK